ncbi:MAG TPA: HEAT repeat domain-containing protein [Candidatus Binatia bacterium]|nr:HEAT repeat domain-containing protein [Candidatus Binatia bacterium]
MDAAGVAGQPLTRAVLATLLLAVGSVALAATERLPALAQQMARARLVVEGTVAGVETYDAGRLALARVTVGRTVKGTADGEVTVLERRDLPSAPELLKPGDTVLLFATPAPRLSSTAALLPAGAHLEPVGGRNGVVVGPPADVREATDILQRLAAASATPEPDAAKRAAAQRAVVFDEIAARHARLVADGATALPSLADLAATLSPVERGRLEAALARTDLPSWVRVTLVHGIGDAHLTALVPALRAIPSPDGALQEVVWATLRQLGSPATPEEIAKALGSDDPSTRSAAVRALAATNAPDAAERIGKVAEHDPNADVRVAATEALGSPTLPGGMAMLEHLFTVGDWPLRQAAGRGINAIGGRPAQEAYGRLAYSDRPEAQPYAVTLLMLTGIDHDDPLMVRIRTSHPDPSVRDIAANGLPVQTEH